MTTPRRCTGYRRTASAAGMSCACLAVVRVRRPKFSEVLVCAACVCKSRARGTSATAIETDKHTQKTGAAFHVFRERLNAATPTMPECPTCARAFVPIPLVKASPTLHRQDWPCVQMCRPHSAVKTTVSGGYRDRSATVDRSSAPNCFYCFCWNGTADATTRRLTSSLRHKPPDRPEFRPWADAGCTAPSPTSRGRRSRRSKAACQRGRCRS